MTRSTFVASILTGLVLAGCGADSERTRETPADAPLGQSVAVEGGAYTNVSVQELQAMLASKDFLLVNVHIPFEGDLPGTDYSIPFNEITRHLELLPAEKDGRLVLYCSSGRMSAEAAEELVKLGYTDVFNLAGGFRAWGQAGLPIERP